ncbi:hypothetical protein [Streptomyces rapamycinicus]|uniref:Uncharacterized protein n=2 Tax=Streptomyces rapamycinicus TaxID=1226757 RepID=A0A0A0NMT9_STRRN|nr:hypothetical protein [Streptomyces rapamycinicus]AGP55715.1 hypothetical protein M271_20855 [Streptomyces rapamycinicus NRRL 5491]MBB4783279.1 hypothetical protein [Streptomyces rapamycinicus]RLV81246.1 hypothetical protein D3C57_122715 [Streptomyces rapamycinicus NRRL 5491]UTO63690.1 hypothetical protein LJB45_16080 [Streptomyces rapamycinicus]UTP31644.1 hypothetical protein LIV37_21190 [Streptomyces rapamycinicus NRRL 5491]
MRRGLRLAAVLTVVLVALTGFKGRGHGHGGGGGGCSSSSSHHSSGSGSGSGSGGYSDSDDESSTTGAGSGGSRYRDYDDDDYGDSASSGSSGGSASPYEPRATVVTCAGKGKGAEESKDKSGRPAATVKVRNRSGTAGTYLVDMNFQDRDGVTLTSGRADVRVPAGKTRTVRVPLDDPSVVGTVVRCEVVSVL